MIYYVTIDQLIYSKRERVEKDTAAVYDITIKDVVRACRPSLYGYKCLGHSIVFKYNGFHKILVYNN